jgi:hypothetical protein
MRLTRRLVAAAIPAALATVVTALLLAAAGPALAGVPTTATVTRLAGADRYATNAAVVGAAFPGQVSAAVAVNGSDWADLTIAGSVATKLGGPVLLVTRDAIPPATAARLAVLMPTHLYALGGPGVLSPTVLAALRHYTSHPVTVYQGADRYATAAAALSAAYTATSQAAGVVADDDWHANLYAAFCGALGQIPIVPVAPHAVSPLIPGPIATFLTALAPQAGGIVGDRVSDAVRTKVKTYFSAPDQVQDLHGADDYAVEVTLLQLCNAGPTAPLFLAYGGGFADALGAGVSVAAMQGNLLLLDGKTVPAGLLPLLSQIHPSQVYVIGGAGLLSDAYVASVVADLGAPGP